MGQSPKRCEAVVLRYTDYGESDRILTLFSAEYGLHKEIGELCIPNLHIFVLQSICIYMSSAPNSDRPILKVSGL